MPTLPIQASPKATPPNTPPAAPTSHRGRKSDAFAEFLRERLQHATEASSDNPSTKSAIGDEHPGPAAPSGDASDNTHADPAEPTKGPATTHAAEGLSKAAARTPADVVLPEATRSAKP